MSEAVVRIGMKTVSAFRFAKSAAGLAPRWRPTTRNRRTSATASVAANTHCRQHAASGRHRSRTAKQNVASAILNSVGMP